MLTLFEVCDGAKIYHDKQSGLFYSQDCGYSSHVLSYVRAYNKGMML